METGRYVFGENIPEKKETPAEKRQREYHATKADIEKRHKAAMEKLVKKQQLDRNGVDAVYNQEHHENAVRAGLRKE